MTTTHNQAIADLNWRDYGGDGEVMLLVHGLGGSLANWDAVGPRLAKDRRVLAIDLPGFGLSPPQADFRLTTHAGAVIRFIETLEGPVTLVGNSMGGLVAELVASRRPDLVNRLILVSPATPNRLPDPAISWPTALRLAVEATPFLGAAILRAITRRLTPEQLVELSLKLITHNPGRVPPDVVENLIDNARDRSLLPWAGVALNRSASSIARFYVRPRDFVAMIRDIAAPTLVVQGDSDHIVSPNAVEWLVSLRLDWSYVVMEDTGHTPQLDAPVRFCTVVEDWLARQTTPGSGLSPQ
jgi:pimeloyl-ACP methyl ester carboxylesterase